MMTATTSLSIKFQVPDLIKIRKFCRINKLFPTYILKGRVGASGHNLTCVKSFVYSAMKEFVNELDTYGYTSSTVGEWVT